VVRILEAPKHVELSLVKVLSNDGVIVSKASLSLEQGVIVGSGTDLSTSGAGEEVASALSNVDGDFIVGVAHSLLWGVL
jgi:hypothetical protein